MINMIYLITITGPAGVLGKGWWTETKLLKHRTCCSLLTFLSWTPPSVHSSFGTSQLHMFVWFPPAPPERTGNKCTAGNPSCDEPIPGEDARWCLRCRPKGRKHFYNLQQFAVSKRCYPAILAVLFTSCVLFWIWRTELKIIPLRAERYA